MENMKEKKYRVAIYCRMGNPDNTDMAPEIKKNVLQGYAVKRENIVAAEIREVTAGCSAERNETQDILNLAGQKARNKVLAARNSRYSWNPEDMLPLKRSFEKPYIKRNALEEI